MPDLIYDTVSDDETEESHEERFSIQKGGVSQLSTHRQNSFLSTSLHSNPIREDPSTPKISSSLEKPSAASLPDEIPVEPPWSDRRPFDFTPLTPGRREFA